MHWSTVLSAILLLTPVQGEAQGTSTTQATPEQANAIRSLYERLLTADAKRDTTEFGRILAPAYTFVPARGDTIMTRGDRIRVAATDTSTSKVQYTLHGCRPQVHGSTAVAHCRYRATIRFPKATADTIREFVSTAVFVQQGKEWQIVATHPSLVRPPARVISTTSAQNAPASADTVPLNVVARAEDAYWSSNVDALMSFYTPNTEGFVLALGDSATKGPRDFARTRAMYAAAFKGSPRPRGKVLNTIVHGPYVVRQYETGSAEYPKALWIFEVHTGKIRRYWNTRVSAP